jgi:hypothetical protein
MTRLLGKRQAKLLLGNANRGSCAGAKEKRHLVRWMDDVAPAIVHYGTTRNLCHPVEFHLGGASERARSMPEVGRDAQACEDPREPPAPTVRCLLRLFGRRISLPRYCALTRIAQTDVGA